jgi:hypothetical protein
MATGAAQSAPQWRALLQRSLDKNRSLAYARYLQLATVRPDGRPANRTVVFRCGGSGGGGARARAGGRRGRARALSCPQAARARAHKAGRRARGRGALTARPCLLATLRQGLP